MQKTWTALLRISLGWLLFYAGITKITNPAWFSAGYLENAKTFKSFFAFFAQPDIVPITMFLNEWGLTLVGVALILGIFVRPAAFCGVLLMLLYYFPVLDFPHPDAHSYIVDDHIIYSLALLLLGVLNAGSVWGLQKWASRSFLAKIPVIGKWV